MPDFLQRVLLKNVIRLRCCKPSGNLAIQRLVLSHYKSSIYEDERYMGYYLRKNDSFCMDKISTMACDPIVVETYFLAQKHKFENNEYGCYGQENRDLDEFCIKITDKSTGCFDKRKIKSGRRCVNWHKSELIRLIEEKLKFKVDHTSSRIEMCRLIENFFKSKRLIENDETCGTQYKRKTHE